MDDIEIVDIKIPENNNQKFPIGTILVFVVLILGIVLFFVYDKFLKKENIAKSFSLNQEQITMSYNQVYNLSEVIVLDNLELSNLQIISNNNLVSVDNYDLISGNTSGEVNITITYKNLTKTLKVIVNDGIDRIPKLSFSRSSIDLNKNSNKDIYDYLNIKNLNKEDIKFSSSDIDIVNIVNGKIITYDKEGNSIVKAKYNDLETELKVIIGNKYLYFIEDEFILEKNKTYLLEDYIDIFNIEISNILYKVDDLSILYIERGKIKTRDKSGEATITAYSGELVDKIKIIIE